MGCEKRGGGELRSFFVSGAASFSACSSGEREPGKGRGRLLSLTSLSPQSPPPPRSAAAAAAGLSVWAGYLLLMGCYGAAEGVGAGAPVARELLKMEKAQLGVGGVELRGRGGGRASCQVATWAAGGGGEQGCGSCLEKAPRVP